MPSVKIRQIIDIGYKKVQQVKKEDIQNDTQEDQSKPATGQPGFFNCYRSNLRVTNQQIYLSDLYSITLYDKPWPAV